MNWLQKLRYIVSNYEKHISTLLARTEALHEEQEKANHYIKKATKLHVDIAALDDKLSATVILCGQYRGKDHVQVFRLPPGDMPKLIDSLRYMKRAATIETIDAPVGLDATVAREQL
jgi:hypothetical protein